MLSFLVNLELMKNLWIPNIFIYNLKSFKTIDVLSKLAGLWIDAKKRIYYSQATHITFICKQQGSSILKLILQWIHNIYLEEVSSGRLVSKDNRISCIHHCLNFKIEYLTVGDNVKNMFLFDQ